MRRLDNLSPSVVQERGWRACEVVGGVINMNEAVSLAQRDRSTTDTQNTQQKQYEVQYMWG